MSAENTHLSWNVNTPACKWDGVHCNEREEIVRIAWSNRDLSGTPDWIHLSRVECSEVHLSLNALDGEIPLKFLPSNIIWFTGTGNKFNSTLELGEMPEHLQVFSLSYCDLHGPISLQHLPHGFLALHLMRNHLTGSLDLGSLPTTMDSLDLSFNGFSGPVNLHSLPVLIRVFLDNNPNLSGEYDPFRAYVFRYTITIEGTQIKRIPSGASLPYCLPLRYAFDSDVWKF